MRWCWCAKFLHQFCFFLYLADRCKGALCDIAVPQTPRHLDVHFKYSSHHSHFFSTLVFCYSLGVMFVSMSLNTVKRERDRGNKLLEYSCQRGKESWNQFLGLWWKESLSVTSGSPFGLVCRTAETVTRVFYPETSATPLLIWNGEPNLKQRSMLYFPP